MQFKLFLKLILTNRVCSALLEAHYCSREALKMIANLLDCSLCVCVCVSVSVREKYESGSEKRCVQVAGGVDALYGEQHVDLELSCLAVLVHILDHLQGHLARAPRRLRGRAALRRARLALRAAMHTAITHTMDTFTVQLSVSLSLSRRQWRTSEGRFGHAICQLAMDSHALAVAPLTYRKNYCRC